MFTLSVVTPEKKVLTDVEVDEIIVPGSRGELNILPGHAPLMTTLRTGQLRYRLKNQQQFQSAVVSWGYCEVNPQGINILADTCELPEEIDPERSKRALAESQKRLEQAGLSPADYQKLQRKVDRAQARLDLAKNT